MGRVDSKGLAEATEERVVLGGFVQAHLDGPGFDAVVAGDFAARRDRE